VTVVKLLNTLIDVLALATINDADRDVTEVASTVIRPNRV